MKLLSKNALFNLRINIIIGDETITGIATGTALTLRALPLPLSLKIYKNPQLNFQNE
jgi:hypothetical protein